ncbi:MAG: general secretion pathway protein GspB [Nitrospiraceae bacterium]|nr:general secretion pathway protein GspB [Nitrospiraceae bacterium]
MSYILEALKKLEQKRRREEGTHLLSDQHPAALPRKRRPLWPYLLFLALLLNAGLLLWWLRPWPQAQSGRSAALQSRETIKEDSRTDAFPGREDRRDSGAALPAPSSGISMPPAQERVANETPPPAAARDADLHSPETRQLQKRDLTPRQRTIGINELPPALRTALPDLTISGHFFDAIPSSRVVIIGGRTLHEGQAVAPGLKLEQITRDGVVFSYQGYRFREAVF